MENKVQGSRDKVLFTPGPLTCSLTVKQAMLRDLGSRDSEFIDIVREIREELLSIADVSSAEFASILLQGSGTYCVEAAIHSVLPRTNATATKCLGVTVDTLEFDEDTAVDVTHVERWLHRGESYALVCIVHCETSSGVLNPVAEVASAVRAQLPHAVVLVDAMSSFGAVPLELQHVDLLVSSANKCLQGVPGFAFLKGLEGDGQFRFTPPTHALLAFRQALREYIDEGGLAVRAARYWSNCDIIHRGMTELGFQPLLGSKVPSAAVISSFRFLEHPNFRFEEFYKRLSDMGQVIYPGKVTQAPCFRIGHIGALWPEHMHQLLRCVRLVLQAMQIPLPKPLVKHV
ncbi:hypothetical protein B566_EDAN001531 [Ephemera danica]|nr:hypothetical protein B566_EDAN001531 [Ephemera danica]